MTYEDNGRIDDCFKSLRGENGAAAEAQFLGSSAPAKHTGSTVMTLAVGDPEVEDLSILGNAEQCPLPAYINGIQGPLTMYLEALSGKLVGGSRTHEEERCRNMRSSKDRVLSICIPGNLLVTTSPLQTTFMASTSRVRTMILNSSN